MKKILFVAALACVAVGCKKKSGTAAGGATCAAAIDNSMAVSKADMAKMPGFTEEMAGKMRDIGVSHCESDKWPDDARKCMVDAKTMAEAQACYDKLSQDQRDKMNKAAMELATTGAGSAGGTPPTGSAAGSDTAGSAAGSDTAGSAAGSGATTGAGSAADGSAAGSAAGSAGNAAGSAGNAAGSAGGAAGSAGSAAGGAGSAAGAGSN